MDIPASRLRMRIAVLAALAVSLGVVVSSSAAQAADTPPTVGGIDAKFVQSAYATFYTIKVEAAAGVRVTYAWTLEPPKADPSCNSFAGKVDINPAASVWHHNDTDGCDHKKEGPEGHLGTVTVVVTALPFICTATYFGTNTGTGKPANCVNQHATPTSTSTYTPPKLIPLHGNPVDDPVIVYKRVMGELSKENLQIAKNGGLFSFIPYFKDAVKATGGLKEKDTFVEVILEKVGLSKVGLGTAAFKKGFAIISIVGDVSAITFNLGALYQGWQAADPPRSDFNLFATVAVSPSALPASLTADAPAEVTAAANALFANSMQLKNTSAALLTTFERVQGAYAAHNANAEARQAALGAKFAESAATLLAAQPSLAASLVAATRSVGGPVVFPASVMAAAAKARTSVSPSVAALYQQFGFSAKETAGLKAGFLQPVSGSVVFPDFIASKGAAVASQKGAASLQGFAKFLRMVSGS